MLKSLILAVALTATIAVSAEAAGRCGERQGLLKQLSETYGETHVAIGTVENEAILEVLASKNGTWTAVISRPDGTSCVVATGQNWEALPLQTADFPVWVVLGRTIGWSPHELRTTHPLRSYAGPLLASNRRAERPGASRKT